MQAADYSRFAAFPDLGLSPVLLHIGRFDLRWYSIAYLAGIFVGYWYLLKLIKAAGVAVARRHADDLVFYAALGIILGGRIGYVLFYNLSHYLQHPIEILKLWDGGMSFHGGVIGTSLGIFYFAHKEKLSWLGSTTMSPAACRSGYSSAVWPISLIRNCGARRRLSLGRPLPQRRTPSVNSLVRRVTRASSTKPFLEGIVLFGILWWMFWKTNARYEPGKLVGAFIFFYGLFRFGIEFIREPDSQLVRSRRRRPAHGSVAVRCR